MRFVVTTKELINIRYLISDEQGVLSVLKSKGAPVKGTLFLRADFDNYTWSAFNDIEYNMIYNIVPKEAPTTKKETV